MPTRTRAPGEVLSTRYELRRRLGAGGAGVVFDAHDRVLERPVAVKLLHAEVADDPDAARRFRTEATSAAKLTHPNAITVYDIGHDDGSDYLVMELVDGPSLATVLAGTGDGPIALPWPAVAAIGRMVAGALDNAHRRGMIHRDVKPANILLTREGSAKVADFGIARALGDAASRATAPGMVIGTARYLAPEQLRDDPVDARADVYALGLSLYEALTGVAPWGDGTATEIATRRLTRDLPPASEVRDDIPPGLDTVVACATRLAPDERYASGEDLARALAPFVPDDATRQLARIAGGFAAAASSPGGPGGRTAVLDDEAAAGAPSAPPHPQRRRDDGAGAATGAAGTTAGADRTAHQRRDPHAAPPSTRAGEAESTRVAPRGARPAPTSAAGSRPRRRRRRKSIGRRFFDAIVLLLLLTTMAIAGAIAMLVLLDVDLTFDLDGLQTLLERFVSDDGVEQLRDRWFG